LDGSIRLEVLFGRKQRGARMSLHHRVGHGLGWGGLKAWPRPRRRLRCSAKTAVASPVPPGGNRRGCLGKIGRLIEASLPRHGRLPSIDEGTPLMALPGAKLAAEVPPSHGPFARYSPPSPARSPAGPG